MMVPCYLFILFLLPKVIKQVKPHDTLGRLMGFVLSIGSVWAQPYQPRDLTAENTFSNNIEGPNVDKAGNLYVVNFQRDGTIGLVKPNGEVELFVTLPEGSVANAIMFDKRATCCLPIGKATTC